MIRHNKANIYRLTTFTRTCLLLYIAALNTLLVLLVGVDTILAYHDLGFALAVLMVLVTATILDMYHLEYTVTNEALVIRRLCWKQIIKWTDIQRLVSVPWVPFSGGLTWWLFRRRSESWIEVYAIPTRWAWSKFRVSDKVAGAKQLAQDIIEKSNLKEIPSKSQRQIYQKSLEGNAI